MATILAFIADESERGQLRRRLPKGHDLILNEHPQALWMQPETGDRIVVIDLEAWDLTGVQLDRSLATLGNFGRLVFRSSLHAAAARRLITHARWNSVAVLSIRGQDDLVDDVANMLESRDVIPPPGRHSR
jgi:hypothetical protein